MPKESDDSELEKLLGKDISQIAPTVREIILSALKKAKEKLAKQEPRQLQLGELSEIIQLLFNHGRQTQPL